MIGFEGEEEPQPHPFIEQIYERAIDVAKNMQKEKLEKEKQAKDAEIKKKEDELHQEKIREFEELQKYFRSKGKT